MLPMQGESAKATPPIHATRRSVYVDGRLVPRDQASVSVFDSGFVLGDGVWEGLRLIDGRLVSLSAHLDRLYEGARSIALDIGLSREELTRALRETLAANRMSDGVHIRLMVTRGVKARKPRSAVVIGRTTIVIVAEHKAATAQTSARGQAVHVEVPYERPDVFDLHLNSHSRLNLIQALLQAIHAGADEALMLDPRGCVASCNSTNFFIVRRDELWTSTGAYSFKGITQQTVLDAWRSAGGTARECDFTLAQVYSADEAFVTGTLGGVTPVVSVDGRMVGAGRGVLRPPAPSSCICRPRLRTQSDATRDQTP